MSVPEAPPIAPVRMSSGLGRLFVQRESGRRTERLQPVMWQRRDFRHDRRRPRPQPPVQRFCGPWDRPGEGCEPLSRSQDAC